ncbi:MAG: type II secretion system protein [Candidatus Gastranaerophilaceae bacterium]
MTNRIKKAFTLAESLVVIGIIGVIATLTIPNLKNTGDDQIYAAKAKKVYAELQTAYERAVLKYGNPSDWGATFGTKVQQYLSVDDASGPIILKDGASVTFTYTAATSTAPAYYTISFDVDGPQKGYNTYGKDMFYASVTIANALDTPTIEPYYYGYGSVTSGTSPNATYNSLHWILQYGNEDYNDCTVKWSTQTVCE